MATSSPRRTPVKHHIRVDCAPNVSNSPYADPKSPIASKQRTPNRTPTKHMASPAPKRSITFSPNKLSPDSRKQGTERGNQMFSPAEWRKSGTVSRASREPSMNTEITRMVHAEEFLEAYVFMKHLPPLPSKYKNRKPVLPPKKHSAPKCTLVLDLDETLVHCSVEPIEKYDLIFPVRFNGVTYRIYMRRRPHLKEFLKTVSKQFEVICFTASQQVYGDKVLNIIDPDRQYIKHRVFRDSCVNVQGNFLKDLSILGRDFSSTLIIDNSPQAFSYQIENGIPIISWFEDDEDTELLKMLPILSELLVSRHDVQGYLEKKFRLREVIANVSDDAFLIE